ACAADDSECITKFLTYVERHPEDFKKGIALLRMSDIANKKPAPAKSRSRARGAGGAAKDRCADESGTDQDADKQTKQTESLPVRGERVIVCL
ncbi:unnamed protein product, partial [Symbiodinium microadriaticum]